MITGARSGFARSRSTAARDVRVGQVTALGLAARHDVTKFFARGAGQHDEAPGIGDMVTGCPGGRLKDLLDELTGWPVGQHLADAPPLLDGIKDLIRVKRWCGSHSSGSLG
ncbi:MAG: hypothetical protein KatS3mg059_0057 [Thermomicrobiales bacterium]|nr:MAG: hypothetical protein KatS3mg059_0057 [Thermomicrobiales bacterium]